ncbi:ABC transporter ATP-binding protein [Thermanaerothrix sp.]|jgi:ABC-2 type transport system ATP-binding protein|uniref:ABC transporter ATP-binding protein n=1 Tax=Thermanaerothrix sp. TaxID=2972675 RepID=UPI002ADDBA6A|nr:ABC transporter ATP-binding protein [Thermanaerothrix sp.]
MSEVIVTKDLTKKYGDFVAVDHLNLTVRKGEVFGLLGPNGAGKTTTILMILGLTEPTSGSIRVLGFDPTRQPLTVKAHVGYLPDQVGFYDELTAYENLIYIAKLNGLSRDEADRRIQTALEKVNLIEMRDKPVATFSRGMRQRLGVAEVLIKQPQIIIMDEPTQGLDPEGAREFLDIIRNLRSEGITILLSSHLLHQVQAVCDRVGLFHRGKMMLVGTVDELGRKVLGKAFRIYMDTPNITPAVLEALKQIPGAVNVRALNATTVEIEATSDIRHEAAKALIAAGGQLQGLSMEAQSLDEIYAQYFQEVEHVRA